MTHHSVRPWNSSKRSSACGGCADRPGAESGARRWIRTALIGGRVIAASLVALALVVPVAGAVAEPAVSAGESIYLRGVLRSGAPLRGKRETAGIDAIGAQAACVNCHQRSGLGSAEGSTTIPPITGEYLFAPRAHDASEAVLPYVESMHGNRDPYDETTLARAIREGLDSQGRPLSVLMPRFALDGADMAALIEYLKKLSVHRVAGVSDTMLHFATIFTPDADRVKRGGVLDVLEHYVAEKNSFPFRPSPPMRTSSKTAYSKSMYMAHRHWQLHVWDLTGPAGTWAAQLDKHMTEEPVYAVLSGLGGDNWAPVHEFCERHEVPCLFPNVEVPVVADRDFYPLYLSKGVLLEAELIATTLIGKAGQPPAGSVLQIYRAGDSGEPAAAALAARLEAHHIQVRNEALPAGTRGLAKAVDAARDAAVLVLWLRPADIEALGQAPPGRAKVYMSGIMGGLENSPLPSDWRAHTLMAYPFDLPDKRGVRLDYPLGWFKFRHIPVVAQQVQADTYLACSLLADALNNHMADVVARPYLIEQMQDTIERRIITGYYPHLALATNQRFASKGGYIAHFADARGTRLAADSNWIVPGAE
jgi:Cytochrome c